MAILQCGFFRRKNTVELKQQAEEILVEESAANLVEESAATLVEESAADIAAS